jgi:hypothetical protein
MARAAIRVATRRRVGRGVLVGVLSEVAAEDSTFRT